MRPLASKIAGLAGVLGVGLILAGCPGDDGATPPGGSGGGASGEVPTPAIPSRWAEIEVGAHVRYRIVEDGFEVEQSLTVTEATEAELAIETTTRSRAVGETTWNEAPTVTERRRRGPPPPAPVGPDTATAQRAASVTIAGRALAATLTEIRRAGGPVLMRTWTSGEVPPLLGDGLLRIERDGATTHELLEWRWRAE